MAGVTQSIMECRNYSVQDIMNIYGVGEESVRNFIKKHQKNNDFVYSWWGNIFVSTRTVLKIGITIIRTSSNDVMGRKPKKKT